MKNKQNRLSKLKHELFQEKAKGKKFVIRKLTEEAEFIGRIFSKEEYFSEISIYFSPTFSPKDKPAIIKELYYDYWKKYKKRAIKKLGKNERKRIQNMGMKLTEI